MNIHPYRPAAAVQPDPATVAQWLGGDLREGALAPDRLVGLATLDEAAPDQIGFVAGDKAAAEARTSRAGLLIVAEDWDTPGRARVVVAQVWEAVARLMEMLYPQPRPAAGVHSTAVIGDGVALGKDVSIGPYCVVGDGCRLGDGAILGPHCILGEGCEIGGGSMLVARVTCVGKVLIGERVIVHPGAVIGADGFKFEPVGGKILKIPQVGAVVIEDDVEIGACTTIDRAFLYETRVGRGSKIDNLVQIAHNVQVGPGCVMAAHVGIAGSTRLGAGCMLGGKAGLADGLTIGNRVMIGAYAGVHSDWPDGSQIIGAPAMPMKPFWRLQATIQKLPEMARRLRALEQRLEDHSQNDEG